MSRIGILPVLVLIGFAAPAVPAAAAAAPPPPSGLRCEYLVNPMGLDETAPRLFWRVESPARGQRQTAYQVLVAASEESLRAGRGDLWDSGRVASDQTTHVVYQGSRLTSRQACYWTVRWWDRDGNVSGYSAPARWEMGLLDRDDWQARWIGLAPSPPGDRPQPLSLADGRWIWYPEGDPQRDAPVGVRYFRRRLDLPGAAVARARMALAVDDEYVLFVNGREAARGAGWQSPPALDLTESLHHGPNILALEVKNHQGPAGVLGRLLVDSGTGKATTLELDSTWKAADREQAGWKELAFDDRAWVPARPFARSGDDPWKTIQVTDDSAPPPAPYLRKDFMLERPVRRARVYVTALGLYELRLNGQRVGEQQLAPGWTDYRKRVQYQTYDVTRLLRRGANAAGVILGDGWYAGSLGPDLKRNHFGPYPLRLRLQLEVEFQDGTRRSVVTDDAWQGATGPILASDLYAGETYDARLERPGWDTAGADRTSRRGRVRLGWRAAVRGRQPDPQRPPVPDWRPVSVLTDQDPALSAQVGPPIRLTGEVTTRRVTEPLPGRYVFDLGQNLVGMARLRVRGPRGTRVTLRFGEVLNPDGTVYRANLRRARATDEYVLRGGGWEVFEPHFTYHGFRYVEVTGYPGRPDPAAIGGRVLHSDLPPTSFFNCSSDLVNRLQQNVVWGQRGNLMSVPTDCPQRDERLGWMGDAELFARTACFNMEMAGFFTKWMRDIVDAQSPEGFFSDVSPRVVDLADGAPSWADAGIIIPWTVWQCYGDTRIVDRNFGAMARYVDLLVRANPDLLWLKRRNNDFGDWVAAGGKTSKELIASAYLAYDLRLMAEMARATGREADAAKYGDLAARARAAFNARFGTADGRYASDSQTAYSMVLGMDLAPPDRRAAVAERLVEAVRRTDDHLSTGFIGTAFLLPALTETGHNDLAYRLLLQRTYPSWGYMIDRGATTIWELWNSDTEGPAMNSRNHFAFGTVGEWLQRSMAGIDTDPAAPGYRRVVVRPRPGPGVTAAEARYAALPGRIESAWSLLRNGVRLTVTVPANTAATVYLPRSGAAPARVLEGGKPIWQAGRFVPGVAGVTAGRDVGDAMAFDVGSGSYVFELQSP